MAAIADPVIEQALTAGTPPAVKGDEPTSDAPQTQTADEQIAAQQLDEACKAALIELRRTFVQRYQPKRMRFVAEASRSFEALRGNTYALLNDQSAALDTINQMMQGFLGQGDDPQLYAHNDNIYQAFALIYVAALSVDLGKVRYQPADAQDDEDLAIAKKGSTIQAYNERKNNAQALMQLKLLYLWLTGSFFRYTRYVIDGREAGTSNVPQIETRPCKIAPDGYICHNCGTFVDDSKASLFQSSAQCPKCGAELTQKEWFEGPTMDLPVQVGEIEQANGMTKCDIVNGLCVNANPDALELKDTEMLDYTVEVAPGKVRAAYPAMYAQIQPNSGTDSAMGGDAAKIARAGMTTPGSNNRPITAEGLGSYSRCWLQKEAFYELQDENLCKELVKRYPKGCKMVLWGDETVLEVKAEALLDHWTWCGTINGTGLYSFAVGKVVLDVQERVTNNVNKVEAYDDRVAFGTMLYDADYIDGSAMTNKVLTPGNMTPVSRTDEETGQRVPLDQLFHQMTFQIDPELRNYSDVLTRRAQFLCGVMPQVFGGSDSHIETARGQNQALNTALGRLKLYIRQMRLEDAQWARAGVKCSIVNMDEEINIVQEGDIKDSWQSTRMLKAELTGDFFTYPETDEGFPETYEEVRERMMTLLADNQKMPFVMQMLSDPDVAATVAHYVLPRQLELTAEPERARVKTILHRLSQDPRGPVVKPNPNPGGPPIVVPSIVPQEYDDLSICNLLSKKWLQKNWEQEQSNPKGFANVWAFEKITGQMDREQQAEKALVMQQQAEKAGAKGQ